MNSVNKVDILIKDASELLTCKSTNPRKPKRGKELADVGLVKDGTVAIKDGKIVFVGKTSDVSHLNAKTVIDAKGKIVMPGFVDCHTHAIFYGSREDELLKKQQGISYLEILKQGGGILSTVEKTRRASKEELYEVSKKRFNQMLEYGTTTVEVKSGYGLNFKDEKKILEIAGKLAEESPIDVVKTYLGAHAIPTSVSREEYIREVLSSLEKIKPYAEFCDVFCEKGVFSVEETKQILSAAKTLGFKLKLHAEQNSTLNSVEFASKLGTVSVDHLEHISTSGIQALANSDTIGVLLPGCPFYLMEDKYAPARELVDSGVRVAIASNFNPGSCPTFNMQFIIALATLKMKLTPAEAINAATINASFAVDRASEIGSLEVGKKADVIILDIENHNQLPYYFGINLVEKVIKGGELVYKRSEQINQKLFH